MNILTQISEIQASRSYCFTLVLLISLSVFCEAQSWQFKKEQDGIRIYLREATNSKSGLKELKITKTFHGDLQTIAAVLSDVDAFPNWVYKCANAKIVKSITDWEIYFYSETKLPWPLSNRDVVLHSKMFLDNGVLVSESTAVDGIEPKYKGKIRLSYLHSIWTFTPLSNGKITMSYILHSEAGGAIPDWLVNLAIDEGPVKTIQKFLDLIKDEKYQSEYSTVVGVPASK